MKGARLVDFIVGFFGGLSSLGVSVVMPIVLTIIGVLFGAGFGKSLNRRHWLYWSKPGH